MWKVPNFGRIELGDFSISDSLNTGHWWEVPFRKLRRLLGAGDTPAPVKEKTCLVLSVGGLHGLAHIGAINALREAGVEFDSVFGNSMGAIIGSMLAFDPHDNLLNRANKILAEYTSTTLLGTVNSPQSRKLLEAGLSVLKWSLGAWGPGLRQAAAKVLKVRKLDIGKLEEVLDKRFQGRRMETMAIRFATSYFRQVGDGVAIEIKKSGNIAAAICRSASNPYLFKNLDLQYLDPGLDRMSVVPINDANELFQPTRIFAVNASDMETQFNVIDSCEVIVIPLRVPKEFELDYRNLEKTTRQLVEFGYMQTKEILLKAGFPLSAHRGGNR